MRLKAGICGVGSFYSDAFARAAMGHPQVELVAYAHLDQDDEELRRQRRKSKLEWGQQYGLKAYSQVDEMVKSEELDLVFIASPDNIKAEHAIKAADAGAHVYLAKPMCTALHDADAMIEAAKRNKVLISALMPARYDGAIRAMYDHVANGAVGRVLTVRAWIQHGCFSPNFVFEGSPEFGPGQGGIELSLGFYTADLILWVIDSRPIRAYAEYDNLATHYSIWMDTGKGLVRFEDGRMGSMDIIYNVSCGAPAWELEAVGSDGIIRAHPDVMEGILWHKDSPGTPRIFYRYQNNVIGEAVRYFVRSCLGDAPLDVSLEHGRRVLELALAWKQSAATHLPVSMPLVDTR